MPVRSRAVILVAAAFAAAIFLLVWQWGREGAGAPGGGPIRGLPKQQSVAGMGAGSAAAGRSRSVQRVVATRLGHPPDLKLIGVKPGRYLGKVSVVCGAALWRGQTEPVPFILAGRRLTRGDEALAIADHVEGCKDLRKHVAIATP